MHEKPHENRHPLRLPRRMREKLKTYQRQVWLVKLTEALCAGVCGLAASFLLVFVLDRFFDTSNLLRLMVLVCGTLGFALWMPRMCHKWIWKNRRLTSVARLLKSKHPQLGDELQGVIELIEGENANHSRALCEAALQQADEQAARTELKDSVPHPRHRQWIMGSVAILGLVVVGFLVVPEAGRNTLSRWLKPWESTERYTFAQLEAMPDSIVIPLAEQTNLRVGLAESTPWRPTVATASIGDHQVTANLGQGNSPTAVNTTRQNDLPNDLQEKSASQNFATTSAAGFDFQLPPLSQTSNINLRVGDARKSIEVIPMARPELTRLAAAIQLPKYLQRPKIVQQELRGGDIKTVRGSTVNMLLTTSRPLSRAIVNGQSVPVIGESIPLDNVQVDEDLEFEVRWQDEFELSALTPLKLTLVANEDQPPTLNCGGLDRQSTIGVDDVLKFSVDATDDFGVKSIGLEWVGVSTSKLEQSDPSRGEKIVLAGNPTAEQVANAEVTFSPTLESLGPQMVALRLFVEDYLPNRQRVYSPVFNVHVISEEEQAIELTTQLGQWMKQAQETYDREQWLYTQNVELSQKSAEELSRPETRRKIEQQAAEEAAQQMKLTAVTDDGESLIRAAMKNDQFSADHIETLAKMLEQLKHIRDNQMSSVAKLLAEAAKAETKSGKNEKSEGSPPKNSAPTVTDDPSTPKESGDKGEADAKDQEPPADEEKPKDDPSIKMNESNMDKPKEESEPGSPAAGKPAKLKLPTVILNDPAESAGGSCPAQKKLQEAVEQQETLLAEFQAVSEELQKLIGNLEGSTFVKRLKALSRRELVLVKDVAESTLVAFGESRQRVRGATQDRAALLAQRQRMHVEKLGQIFDDLVAYSERKNESKYKNVLRQMEELNALDNADLVAAMIGGNDSGVSIAQAELLADHFDRWAEELVGPG